MSLVRSKVKDTDVIEERYFYDKKTGQYIYMLSLGQLEVLQLLFIFIKRSYTFLEHKIICKVLRRKKFNEKDIMLHSIIVYFSTDFVNEHTGESYKSAKEAIDDANDFLLRKMGYENYYSLQINGMNINDKLAQFGSDAFSNRPVFVYGDSIEASRKRQR